MAVMGGLTVLSVQGARSARAMAGRQLELVEDAGQLKLRVQGDDVTSARRPAADTAEARSEQATAERHPDAHAHGRTRATEQSTPPPLTREERLAELAKDHIDHDGIPNDGTRREAEVGLGLEERGDVPGPIRRPAKGDGHSGDFVDGKGRDWDVKAERSRDRLIQEIKANARAAGKREPKLDANKRIEGEFELDKVLTVVEREFATKEGVMFDTRGLNDADLQALRAALAEKARFDPRYKELVRFYP